MMMSLTAIPLLIAAGVAVDYTNLASSRSALQNANDATVLYASRYYEQHGRLPESEAMEDMMAANYGGDIDETKVVIDGSSIVADSRATAKYFVMSMFLNEAGKEISVKSAAPVLKNLTLDIVLSLDTTYSMSADGKMAGLKVAATDFVNTMMDLNKPSVTVNIGVVPFSNYVNVGLENRDKDWLHVPDDYSRPVHNACYSRRDVISQTNCRDATGYSDGVPYTYRTCDNTYGEAYNYCPPDTVANYKWWGCVGSRAAPLTLRDSNVNVPIPGMIAAYDMRNWECPTPVTPLTNVKPVVLAAITALTPRGETYIPDGIMWGQRVLSPAEPFAGTDPTKTLNTVRKILVLMSDGDNTKSSTLPSNPGNGGSNATLANQWTEDACDYAKEKETEVFTITFGTAVSENSRRIMSGCATDGDHYFNASNSAALAQAFSDIASRLNRVRLTM